MNILFHVPAPLSQFICLLWVMLLTLRYVSIQDFLCLCIHIHVYRFVFTEMEPYHSIVLEHNMSWRSFHVRIKGDPSHFLTAAQYSTIWILFTYLILLPLMGFQNVSSYYCNDTTEITHLSLTEGPLTHGWPEERQSGGRIGLGWQRYVLGPPFPVLVAYGPRDRFRTTSEMFPCPQLSPSCPYFAQDRYRWGWEWAGGPD